MNTFYSLPIFFYFLFCPLHRILIKRPCSKNLKRTLRTFLQKSLYCYFFLFFFFFYPFKYLYWLEKVCLDDSTKMRVWEGESIRWFKKFFIWNQFIKLWKKYWNTSFRILKSMEAESVITIVIKKGKKTSNQINLRSYEEKTQEHPLLQFSSAN